jgi:hypothetical protein
LTSLIGIMIGWVTSFVDAGGRLAYAPHHSSCLRLMARCLCGHIHPSLPLPVSDSVEWPSIQPTDTFEAKRYTFITAHSFLHSWRRLRQLMPDICFSICLLKNCKRSTWRA